MCVQLLQSIGDDQRLRDGRLSQAMEQFIQARLFFRFIQTGKLEAIVTCPGATDEEYLGALQQDLRFSTNILQGGVLAMCQDVARYASGRACDVSFLFSVYFHLNHVGRFRFGKALPRVSCGIEWKTTRVLFP